MEATTSAPGPGGTAQHFVVGQDVLQAWWSGFGSAALNRLIEQAFRANPNLAAAKAALRQAQETTAAQRAAFFPTVSANYSPSRQRQGTGTLSPTLSSGASLYTLHTAQLSISYLPDVFGLNRRTVESLAAQEEAQRFQLQATYLSLAANVALAAIQAASLRAQVASTQDMIRAETDLVDLLRRQSSLGYASGLDVAAQEAALAQARQTLPPLIKQLEQARNLLAILTGRLPSQTANADLDVELDQLRLPDTIPLSLPSQLVERRPDVRAAEAQWHAASAEVGIAIANRLPQLSISAAYGGNATAFSQMFSGGNKFWSITGNIAQTLFDAGALKHRQGAAAAALEQAAAQYKATVLAAFQNVADSMYAIEQDAQALRAAGEAEAATRKSFELTRQQMALGGVSALAVLNAEQAYLQTRVTHTQAQAARYADTVGLFQALGGGWNSAH
jgi:NodT family efflux transporter outer membrane factor (OMF) lipoprotein